MLSGIHKLKSRQSLHCFKCLYTLLQNSLVQGVYRWAAFKPPDKSSLMGPDGIQALLYTIIGTVPHFQHTLWQCRTNRQRELIPIYLHQNEEYSVDHKLFGRSTTIALQHYFSKVLQCCSWDRERNVDFVKLTRDPWRLTFLHMWW